MCDIPIEIPDPEKVVRAIKTPYHYNEKKKVLKPAAFRPGPERDDVSVMRLDYMGEDACKAKAKEIPGGTYVGLAAITAGEIRGTGAEVTDSREGNFCGHADISQGGPAPESGKAAHPNLLAKYKALADKARPYLDPEPGVDVWTGPALV